MNINMNINVNIIVAYCENNGIGYRNMLPWRISSDLNKFKFLTQGNNNNAIIMGKNTWLSLPKKPLLYRDNLILSSSLNIDYITTTTKADYKHNTISKSFNNIKELELFIKQKNYDEIWIIGGDEIYKSFLNNTLNSSFIVSKLYVTYIKKNFLCDTFFPIIDNNKYKLADKVISNIDYYDNKINDFITLELEDLIYELI